MSNNSTSLKNLQSALSMELSAIHQYLLHAHVVEDWGLSRLAAKMREEMNEELGHADSYLKRIMFLKGSPEMTLANTPQHAKNLKELFEADLADEKNAIKFYTESAQAANKAGDIGTRNLFETTALDEEGHMSWLELQLDLIQRMGEPAYIAMQIVDPNIDG